ncbi:protein rapunzel-like [Pristis pectinata]|uniref:protein rapunzel-like n=1 Tax=Pristis pectinata TaxID=685728 RepID=UPI00223CC7F3|nr:protein rapunzel-like [Pristis pectinata]
MSQTAIDALELSRSVVEATQAAVVLANSTEKLASTLGVLGPITGVASMTVKLSLSSVDSPELAFMKEQFQAVRNQLDVISGQISEVLREIERSTINNQYFPIEENLKNQFRKYMDILNAAPEFRQKEKEEFLKHFNATKGDQNLHTLYDGVMGFTAVFGKSILDTAMNCDQRNRRLMEGLCARLKNLFCIGLIALLGHAGITGTDEKALEAQWNQKLAEAESKMKSMVDRCINEFAEQAEIDVERLVKEKGGRDNKECSHYILEALAKKYDWVRWSVRVYNGISGFGNHCVIGSNYFHFFRLNNVNIVVSYTTDPKPVDETLVRQLMDGRDFANGFWFGCKNARIVAEDFHHDLPDGYVVHTVKCDNDLWYKCNFPGGCHFWANCMGVTLCIHRE